VKETVQKNTATRECLTNLKKNNNELMAEISTLKKEKQQLSSLKILVEEKDKISKETTQKFASITKKNKKTCHSDNIT